MVTRNQITGLAIAALVITAIVVGAIVYYELRIKGTGKIKLIGLKAYSDVGLTKEVSAIDWGTIAPAGISQVTLYLKSTSTVCTNLTLTTENWNPATAETYLTLTWDYDESLLCPNEVIEVKFTLSVDQSVIGITDFSFDLVITASG